MNKKRNTMKKLKRSLIIVVIIGLSAITLVSCSNGVKTGQVDNSVDTDKDGIPNSIEKTYGTNPYNIDTDGDGVNDKQDTEPLISKNLINEKSTSILEIKIKDARVEDNATDDHLEITLTNTGKSVLTEFDIFYKITDKVNGKQESYYQVLSGLTLNGGETKTIHFDNKVNETGHYYGNMNGLYGTSSNGLTFDIQIHAKGYQPMDIKVEKSKGTAEVSD